MLREIMLREEFEKQVSFKVDSKIYELANQLYMSDFNNNREFCNQLDTLVYWIEYNERIRVRTILDKYMETLCAQNLSSIAPFLYEMFGWEAIIYAKVKNYIRLTDAEIFYVESLLKI